MSDDWRPVPGYERLYEVNDLGQVRSCRRTTSYVWMGKPKTMTKRPKILAPWKDKDGYLRYKLTDTNRVMRVMFAHRAVALAFIPNPHGLPQVAHLNHDPADNRLENLKWASNAENHQDSVTVNRYAAAGPDHTNKRLMTPELVREMRALYAAGDGPAVIARKYEMRIETVTKIVKRQRWIHV